MDTSKEHNKTDDDTEKGQPSVNYYQPAATRSADDAVEDDGTPVLDETDLEENGLTEEDAENIEWDEPKK